jgi:hypothetical protein
MREGRDQAFGRHRRGQLVEVVDGAADVAHEALSEVEAESVAHHDGLNDHVGEVVGHRVRRDQPTLEAKPLREMIEVPLMCTPLSAVT